MPLIRNRTSMPGFDTSRRYWNAIMAIWIWRWRRTMREKARWTERMESRPFERHGVTYKKFRMLIFGQDRGALKECGRTRARSARTWMRLAGLFSRDRKSTRLNSSHSQISYAVFCLKKKNDPHPARNAYYCDYNHTTSTTQPHRFRPRFYILHHPEFLLLSCPHTPIHSVFYQAHTSL